MKATLSANDARIVARALANLLRDSSLPGHALRRIRKELRPDHFDRAVDAINADRRWREREFHPAFPTRLDDLDPTTTLEAMPLRREVQWARAYLRPHVEALNSFVDLATQYHVALSTGKYVLAGECLATIEQRFGYSLWLLKSRIYFAQVSSGLEAQKSLAKSYIDRRRARDIVAAIAHYASERNEPSVTSAGLRSRLGRTLAEPSISPSLQAYFRYHITPVPAAIGEDAASILLHESYGAVIDYYLALVHVLPAAIELAETRAPTLSAIGSLSVVAASRRLRFLKSWLHGNVQDVGTSLRPFPGLDFFLRGEYSACMESAERTLDRDPLNADAFEYLAKSRVLLARRGDIAPSTPTRAMLANLESLIRGDDGADLAADELEKFLFNWSGSPLTAMIATALAKFARPGNVAGLQLGVSRAVYAHPYFSAERTADIVHDLDRLAYSRAIATLDASPLVTAYAGALAGSADAQVALAGLAPERQLLLEATRARLMGDVEAYQQKATALLASPHGYYRLIGIRWACDAHVRAGNIVTLIRHVADAAITEPSARAFLPIHDSLRLLKREHRKELAASPALSIVLDLYSRHDGSEYDDLRAVACAAVLRRYSADRPSRMKDVESIPEGQYIYFLRYVCTEDVLDGTGNFGSSLAVAEERLAVCRMLMKIDPANATAYESEIGEILRRLVVKRRMREIDESKIAIDQSRVRANLPVAVREAANRYFAYQKTGSADLRLSFQAARVADTISQKTVGTQLKIIFPGNDALDTLRTVVEGIRDEYVSATEYGLDGVLSMSIRHGTLAARLRNPLEATQLITKKDEKTQQYRANQRWMSNIENRATAATVNRLLTELADSYDALIDEILRDWIRVKKISNELGEFDFQIRTSDLEEVHNALNGSAEFEDLLAAVFAILNERLTERLRQVRTRIDSEARPRALQMLTKLETELLFVRGSAAAEIHAAISQSRTELQHALERIQRWFQLSQGNVTEPFYIDDAISLAAENIRVLDPSFRVRVDIDKPESVRFPGALLTSVFYILHNALENIVRHSHCERSVGQIVVRTHASGLDVRVSNEVHEDARENARRQIDQAMERLSGNLISSLVGKDRGSGLAKIRAILARDFDAASRLRIELGDDGVASLSFWLPAEEER